jgi:hypothetical protein
MSKGMSSREKSDCPSDWDTTEAARATIRSACVAAEQRFCRSDGNPVHAWEAIRMLTQPTVAPMPLPEWCNNYLHRASQALLAAAHDGATHASVVSRALGFTRVGWSTSKAFASDQKAIRAALRYEVFRDKGMSAASAYEELRKHARLAEADSLRKLVRAGKRMLRHVPESAQAVPRTKLTRQEARVLDALVRATEAAQQSVRHAAPCTRQRTSIRQPARWAKPQGQA